MWSPYLMTASDADSLSHDISKDGGYAVRSSILGCRAAPIEAQITTKTVHKNSENDRDEEVREGLLSRPLRQPSKATAVMPNVLEQYSSTLYKKMGSSISPPYAARWQSHNTHNNDKINTCIKGGNESLVTHPTCMAQATVYQLSEQSKHQEGCDNLDDLLKNPLPTSFQAPLACEPSASGVFFAIASAGAGGGGGDAFGDEDCDHSLSLPRGSVSESMHAVTGEGSALSSLPVCFGAPAGGTLSDSYTYPCNWHAGSSSGKYSVVQRLRDEGKGKSPAFAVDNRNGVSPLSGPTELFESLRNASSVSEQLLLVPKSVLDASPCSPSITAAAYAYSDTGNKNTGAVNDEIINNNSNKEVVILPPPDESLIMMPLALRFLYLD